MFVCGSIISADARTMFYDLLGNQVKGLKYNNKASVLITM